MWMDLQQLAKRERLGVAEYGVCSHSCDKHFLFWFWPAHSGPIRYFCFFISSLFCILSEHFGSIRCATIFVCAFDPDTLVLLGLEHFIFKILPEHFVSIRQDYFFPFLAFTMAPLLFRYWSVFYFYGCCLSLVRVGVSSIFCQSWAAFAAVTSAVSTTGHADDGCGLA